MTFNSIPFIILFPLAVIAYRLIPQRFRYIWLLVCSFAFCTLIGKSFPVLLLFIVLITYVSGFAIARIGSHAGKKAVTAAAIVIEIGTLFLYKYLDFALELTGSRVRFNLLLPVGISFFTFRATSYVIDVYRGKLDPEKNILKLALYISFFLTFLSGPITRSTDLIPQFSNAPLPSYEMTKKGIQKMLWGYFLKLAIAGRLAIVVENVYKDAASYSGAAIAFTALSYLFMLYCDFEGYSQIAIGGAALCGIEMKENFLHPFCSENMGQLWKKWHVSLYEWFRDYLYIPLGGSRCGIARKYLNVFIVLLVSGLWHGANMTFVIWGALNGAYIILGQILIPYRDKVFAKIGGDFDRIRTFAKRVGVYILASFTFIFFANENVKSAWLAVKGILLRFVSTNPLAELSSLGLGRFNLALTMIMVLFVLIADNEAEKRSCDTPSLIVHIPTPIRWIIYYALMFAILFSANLTGKEFIYSKM